MALVQLNPANEIFLERVLDVLYEMPIPQAQATTLRYLGGMSMEDIAAHMEVDPEQAAQLAYSGLRQLHEARIVD